MRDGSSHVKGVYTSIPNLLQKGLNVPIADHAEGARLRLTLMKLDCDSEPFGTWTEPDFDGLAQCLEGFVRTDEFSKDQCQALMAALDQATKVARAA